MEHRKGAIAMDIKNIDIYHLPKWFSDIIESIAMDIKNIDIYHLPKWFSDIIEEVDILCEEALRSSVSYNKITEERYSILHKYDFISKLDDGDMEETLELTAGETKALSRFIALEHDKARAESIQMYLLGCSHIFKLLRVLEEI